MIYLILVKENKIMISLIKDMCPWWFSWRFLIFFLKWWYVYFLPGWFLKMRIDVLKNQKQTLDVKIDIACYEYIFNRMSFKKRCEETYYAFIIKRHILGA